MHMQAPDFSLEHRVTAVGDVQIDSANFCGRLKKLVEHWKVWGRLLALASVWLTLISHPLSQANRSSCWANTNALAICVGAASDDLRYLKSISLHYWLFRYELPGGV